MNSFRNIYNSNLSQIIQQIDLNQHWTPPSYHMIQIGSKTPILPPAWVLLKFNRLSVQL